MRRICQQSRRWHQQFFDSARFAGHSQCLRHLQQTPFQKTAYQQRRLYAGQGSKNDDVVVHEFEQMGTNKTTRRPVEPDPEMDDLTASYEAKIKELEEELAAMKEGPFGPNSDLMQSLSPEEREAAQEALGEDVDPVAGAFEAFDREGLDRMLKGAESQGVPEDPAPQVAAGRQERYNPYVSNFNKTLKGALSSEGQARAELWSSYQRCLRHVPEFLTLIPTDVWDALWEIQMGLADSDFKARALGNDMRSLFIPLSDEQLCRYLEGLLAEDDTQTAIGCWEESRQSLGQNADYNARFWPLGVRLYCAAGQQATAQKIAIQCLEQDTAIDATVLEPIVASWAKEASTEKNSDHMWALYLRFKAELGSRFGSGVYESICTTLLDQGYPAMALAVFRDMLLDTFHSESSTHDSITRFWSLCTSTGASITEAEVNRLSLTALTVLPRNLENKFFFGSWIKLLIGHNHVDSAAKVVELMYERGIRPDARHLNGIVGAWLRQKSAPSKQKAEQLAWAMIHARISMVEQRQKVPDPDSPNPHTPGSISTTRPVPPATIETFSTLLLHYTRHNAAQQSESLLSIMTSAAAIAPNTFIHNHLLSTSLRAHNLPLLLQHYTTLLTHPTLSPNLTTFAHLWDAAKLQYDPSRAIHTPTFPSPRTLFAHLTTFLHTSSPETRARAVAEYDPALGAQILRVFCLKTDLAGALCALHGLHQLFGPAGLPDPNIVRVLAIAIARMMPADERDGAKEVVGTGRRGFRRRTRNMTAALEKVRSLLQVLTDRRGVERWEADGVDVRTLGDEEGLKLSLTVLSDLLLLVLGRVRGVEQGAVVGGEKMGMGTVENEVRMVAKVMGVDVDGVRFTGGKEMDVEVEE